MEWVTFKGKSADLHEFLAKYKDDCWDLYIGTDSQKGQRHTRHFSTVLVAWKKGTGAFGIQCRCTVNNMRSGSHEVELHDQLTQETWHSIKQAKIIKELVDKNITIHLDINSNDKYDSGRFEKELVGFVQGLGYKYAIKPNAWAASGVADKLVR